MQEKWTRFANEYVVSLFPLFMLADAFTSGMKKVLGKSANLIFKVENHAVEYYIQSRNWHAGHLNLVGMIRKNPAVLRNFYVLMEALGKKQIKELSSLRSNLKNENNRYLNNIYQRYVRTNTEVYTYGLILPLLDYHDSTFLSDELENILKTRHRSEYFGILTTPLRPTFNKLQELDLLKILVDIKKDQNLLKQFRKLVSPELLDYLKNNRPRLVNILRQHTNKYCWTTYVYEGPAVDILYFLDILGDLIKRHINPTQELKKYQSELASTAKRQREIIKELKASRYEKQIIKLAREMVFIKPYRRELQSHSYYQIEPLLNEVASRLHLSLKQVRMMLPVEIADGLLKNKINTNLINQRMDLVVYGGQGDRHFCLSGCRAEEFIRKNFARESKIKLSKEIIGSVAFKGQAKGVVRVINMPEEMVKMEEGNILVSAATSPNLMPAIRKAAAIVTDEGGLTCHAAIVSRELRIPCVVGTKFATKVLHDGDLVEVDAEKGIVKIIKKN